MSVQNLLNSVHQRLEWMREARELYEPHFAPRFNVVSLFDPKEIGLSRILGDLLDPKGTHGQRDAFLKLFLSRIELDKVFGDTRLATVTREDSFVNDQGRARAIDIVIKNREAILAIENKPWAEESENQVKDYWIATESRAKTASPFLLFLSGTAREIASMPKTQKDRLVNEGKLKERSYVELLVPWLDDCIRECRAERVRNFVLELKGYIISEFSGAPDMTETNAIVDLALKNEESLTSALDIGKSIDQLKRSLIEKLNHELRQIAESHNLEMEGKVPKESKGKVFFRRSNVSSTSDEPWVCIQFYGPDMGANYGIVLKGDKGSPILQELLARELGKKYDWPNKEGEYFLWGCELESNHQDWRMANEPWVKLRDGSFAQETMDKVVRIFSGLERALNNMKSA
ncbi:MAG: PD-(D/E)XK nuclease family protein [Thiotrichales bacterium]